MGAVVVVVVVAVVAVVAVVVVAVVGVATDSNVFVVCWHSEAVSNIRRFRVFLWSRLSVSFFRRGRDLAYSVCRRSCRRSCSVLVAVLVHVVPVIVIARAL